MTKILGLSWGYHDSAAAIVEDGEVLSASQEERYTRKKFDSNFPTNAIMACLNKANITISDIDCIAVYEEPIVKLDRINSVNLYFSQFSLKKNYNKIENWIRKKLVIEKLIYRKFPEFSGEIFFSHHHISHAAAAFYPSPFSKASIVVIDGIGEWACTSIGYGNKEKIELLKEQRFPHSLGFLYSAFTQYLGFRVNSGEYKVMGLAPYGEPIYLKKIKENIANINNDGVVSLDTSYFDFMTGEKMINENFCKVFDGPIFNPNNELTQREMNIASSIQYFVEEAVENIVKFSIKTTGNRNVVMAGGVALNCVANGKILKNNIVDNLWIQPAAGDAGSALGSALLANYEHYGLNRNLINNEDSQKSSLLGDIFSENKIKESLELYNFNYNQYSEDKLFDKISSSLIEGKVIGVFQGPMEFGPRALGSRSIIGDPRNPSMQKKLNLKIKFRESFRPFAPIVKEEKAKEWFEILQNDNYMLLTADVVKSKMKKLNKEEKQYTGLKKLHLNRSEIPAVTHVNGSARVQTININKHPYIYKILENFEQKTGCPVLVNTSFNIRGEPIVRTPIDALRCFMNTNMDILVLESFFLMKTKQDKQLVEDEYKNFIEED